MKQYLALVFVLAVAAVAGGCASTPPTAAEQAAAPKQDERAPCYVRTGSNYCRRDGGSGANDVKAMSGEQMREAADETRIINMPRTK